MEQEKPIDVIGIGAPIVDIFTNSPYSLAETKFGVKEQFVLIPVGMKTGAQISMHSGGSSANTVSYLSKLGLSTGYFTKLGKDMLSNFLIEDLASHKIDTSAIIRQHGLFGGISIILSTEGFKGHALLVNHGASSSLTASETRKNRNYLASAKWLYISSMTGKDAIKALRYAVAFAHRQKIKVFFAPSRTMIFDDPREVMNIARNSDAVAMNENEFQILFSGSREQEMHSLHKWGVSYVFVTKGESGIECSDNSSIYRISGYKSVMRNSTGAGDCVAGIFLYGLIKDWPIKKILDYAAAAGAIHVEGKELGAKNNNPTIEQIEKYLSKIRDMPVRVFSFKELGQN